VFVNALFLSVYVRTQHRGNPLSLRNSFFYGLLIGAAMLIRIPNLFLVLVPLVGSMARLWRREQVLLSEAVRYLALGIGALVALAPQMVVWKITRGAWLLTNPYKGATPDVTDWAHPKLLEVVFSSNRGFLLWSPLFLVALVSSLLVCRRDRRLGIGLFLVFLLNYYLVATWSYWFGYGPRLFLNALPIAILGLTALMYEAQRRFSFRTLIVTAAAFVIWNSLLLGQYVLKLVPNTGTISVVQVIRTQFTLVPEHIGRLLRAVVSKDG
jgi:hypothetical protein